MKHFFAAVQKMSAAPSVITKLKAAYDRIADEIALGEPVWLVGRQQARS
jgi:hypothetical protein